MSRSAGGRGPVVGGATGSKRRGPRRQPPRRPPTRRTLHDPVSSTHRRRPGTQAGGRRPPLRRAVGADVRWRLVSFLVVIVLCFGVLVGRLVDVQGLSSRRYALFGESQRLHSVGLPAQRGSILDRNRLELAISTRRQTVWADPRAVGDPVVAARSLAPVLGVDEAFLRERLSTAGAFVYLARKVDDTVAARVRQLDLPGVSFLDEPQRYAPSGTLAASVLGTVGIDDQGLGGLELQYEKDLRGRPGQMLVERDPGGRDMPNGQRQLEPPARGRHVVLTIDRFMQYETERALSDQIVASKAKGGIAIVMDPRSGEVLAMTSLTARKTGPPVPSADNMAVTRVYEPGSVNKVITAAAALEEEVITPTKKFYVPDNMVVADATFRDAEPHPPQSWALPEVLSNSSNVGTILIAQKLGKARLDRYLKEFGLGERTALRFPGESAGIIPDVDHWSGTSIATVPIGQGVAVTALQMLGAYNTIANRGVYVEPTLVRATIDAKGKVHRGAEPQRRRVVSDATADMVASMLVGAVERGTGTGARIEGYSVAGKTGTARKPRDNALGYREGAYVASFAGFLPASSPQLSAMVVLDEPTPYFGGVVAAPVFARVAAAATRLYRIPPTDATAGTAVGRLLGPVPGEHGAPDSDVPVAPTTNTTTTSRTTGPPTTSTARD